jgi:hypothetical protein
MFFPHYIVEFDRTMAPRPKQTAAPVAGDIPKTKKYKQVADQAIQQKAFDELMAMKSANSGKKHGDLTEVVRGFCHRDYTYVTEHNLCYCQLLMKQTGAYNPN